MRTGRSGSSWTANSWAALWNVAARPLRLIAVLLITSSLAGCPLFFASEGSNEPRFVLETVEFQITPSAGGDPFVEEYSADPVSEVTLTAGQEVDLDLVMYYYGAIGEDRVLMTLTYDDAALATRNVTVSEIVPPQPAAFVSDNRIGSRFYATQRARIRVSAAADTLLGEEMLSVFVRVDERDSGRSSSLLEQTTAALNVSRIRTSALPSMATPSRISAGESHSLALSSDGQVWAWGNNDFGQVDTLLGVAADVPGPVPVPGVVRAIAAGSRHSLAVTDLGQVYSWGDGSAGQLGETRSTPAVAQVPGLSDIVSVYAAHDVSFAINASSELFAWGDNRDGLLGLPTREIIETPTRVAIGDVVKVAIGREHALAMSSSGALYGWGQSQYRRLGARLPVPDADIRLPELSRQENVSDIAIATDISLVVAGGRLIYYGRNSNRMFENPMSSSQDFNIVPNFFGVIGVVGSPYSESAIAVRRDGDGLINYRIAGSNADGQLTLADTSYVQLPQAPRFPITPLEASLGRSHGLFLQRDATCGAVWSWGSATNGLLGRTTGAGAETSLPGPIRGLGAGSCALLTVSTDNGGQLVSTPAGIDCGPDCDVAVNRGDQILLAAQPLAQGFIGLGGDCASPDGSLDPENPASISVDDHIFCPGSFAAPANNQAPTASFSFGPEAALVVGREVNFDGSASSDVDGSVVMWDWDLDNDGDTERSGESVNWNFTSAGVFPVTLTVTDDGGLTASLTRDVSIALANDAPPAANFTITPASPVAVGTTVTLDASSSTDDVGIVAWDWDFESDGSFDANGEIVTYTPTAAGSQVVRLRVTDTSGQFDNESQPLDAVDVTTFYSLRVVLDGSGTVTVTPPGVVLPNTTDCDGNECFIFNIVAGTELTLEASAFTPSFFTGWSTMECDSVDPALNLCRITMTSDRSVNALFQ